MLTGNVAASINKGTLTLVGTDSDDHVTVEPGDQAGTVRITVNEGTVNGQPSVVLTGLTKDLRIFLADGNDELTIKGLSGSFGVPRNLLVDMANGNDSVDLQRVSVAGAGKFVLGNGNDTLEIDDSQFAKKSVIDGGNGDDRVLIDRRSEFSAHVQFDNKVGISLFAGADVLGLGIDGDDSRRVSISKSLAVNGGTDTDLVAISQHGTIRSKLTQVENVVAATLPSATVRLAHDSGPNGTSNSDLITNDASLVGQVTGFQAGVRLLGGLDSSLPGSFVDLTGFVQPDGTFALSGQQLSNVFTGQLTDGVRTIQLRTTNPFGELSEIVSLTFTLDRTGTAIQEFGLDPTFNTGIQEDLQTTTQSVTLIGRTVPGTTVVLVGTGRSATADSSGRFEFGGIELSAGDNLYSVRTNDLAGNEFIAARHFELVSAVTGESVVEVFNQAVLAAIKRDASNPPIASRNLAIVHLSIMDAVAAIVNHPGYLVALQPAGDASPEAAVIGAGFETLSYLYPAQAAIFDALKVVELAKLPDNPARNAGFQFGRQVAQAVIQLRNQDGWDDYETDLGGTEPGEWRETGPMYAEAMLPQWAHLTPFTLTASDQFLPDGPPELFSAEYAAAYNDVRELGSATSTTRTTEQTQIARFWADGAGTITPSGHWNEIARTALGSRTTSLWEDARLFGALNMALADAGIAVWNTKYEYDFWRPITAIPEAASDANADTIADPNWQPLLITPPFPEYISGHSTYSGAAAQVLTRLIGGEFAFSSASPGFVNGQGQPVVRNYSSFWEAAQEAGRSRIFGGIHFEFSNQDGQTTGRSVGDWVVDRLNMLRDITPPSIVTTSPLNGAVVSGDLTVTGTVFDNLSGVASAEWQIDAGLFTPLVLNSQNQFTLPLIASGLAEGQHVVRIRATDLQGLTSPLHEVRFVLDTQAPTIELGIPDGATVSDQTLLNGAVSGTGSVVTSLTYSIDGGLDRSIIVDPVTGFFSVPMDLSTLSVGRHSLTVQARDAAGQTTTVSRSVRLDAAVPFTLLSVTPLPSAIDVGTTFRPQIFFSRPIDPATLTSQNFFASNSSGVKLPASIVVADDGSFAWLFLQSALPSATTISLTVNGSTILSTDGVALDADGDLAPGGQYQSTFSTVSLEPVVGTSLSGRVVGPGGDLVPMTFDDIRVGPDGIIHTHDDVFLNPIAHVKVFILGLEDQFVFSDSQGFFHFDAVPAGRVKLAIDGRTASNAPTGQFYPEMVMDLDLKVGVENTVVGTMGVTEFQQANLDRTEVYLPLLQTSILTTISDTEPTTVVLSALSAPNLTPEEQSQLTLLVHPGSAIGPDGLPVANAQVGVSMVPTEFVRDMLPESLRAGHAVEITIQAPGVVAFTTPIEIRFPNTFNAPAGSKITVMSFDHTTGLVVPDGTGTVSEDGLTVVSDPGSGISAPGWHFTAIGTKPEVVLRQRKKSRADNYGCMKGDDAAFGDDPFVPLPYILKLNERDALYSTAHLEANARDLIRLTAPGDGLLMFEQFVNGQGQPFLISTVTTPDIYDRIVESVPFQRHADNLIEAIQRDLQNQANNGRIDVNAIDIDQALVTDRPSFYRPGTGVLNALYFAATIGGTQDATASLRDFSANVHEYDPEVGGIGFYSATLHIELCDTYGVGTDDVARKSLLLASLGFSTELTDAIYDFWLLQHRRADETHYVPYEVEIEVDLPLVGSFLIPPGYDNFPIKTSNDSGAETGLGEGDFRTDESGLGTDSTIYYRLHGDDFELSGKGSGESLLNEVMLPPNEYYRISAYQPSTNRTITLSGMTGPSGDTTLIYDLLDADGNLTLTQDIPYDSDLDLISDLGEYVLGTNDEVADSDGDGILDGAELNQGTNPLDGVAYPTGVIANVTLLGTANALDVATDVVYVATGEYGLAVVDVTRFDRPVIKSQLDLSGVAQDVSVDSRLGIVAVASGTALHLVNVANPAKPMLLRSVNLNATKVVVADGTAYAVSGMQLNVVELATGEVLQTLALPGNGPVSAMVREGSVLYVYLAGSHELVALDISQSDAVVVLGEVTIDLGPADVDLFVGNGVAWLITSGIVATYDVTNPAAIALIRNSSGAEYFRDETITLNGSGLALVTADTSTTVQVFNVPNPSTRPTVLTQFELGAPITNVAINQGVGFATTGNRLSVLNYRAFDGLKVPPIVSIESGPIDLNPATPGLQVREGTLAAVRVSVSDDVQVRTVDLLLDGVVVQSDSSFPFDLSAIVPNLPDGQLTGTVTLQVRATDTGGNSTLSAPLALTVSPDVTPPTIVSTIPEEGDSRPESFHRVIIHFSEGMAPASLTADTIRLIGPSGAVVPLAFQMANLDRTVRLTYATLASGNYRVEIERSAVRDRAGNALGSGVETINFSVFQASARFINPNGGAWNNPANWAAGVVPGPQDDVVIDVGDNTPAIEFSTGTATIRSLTSYNPFRLSGGTLTVTGTVQVHNELELRRGTLKNATIIPGEAGSKVTIVGLASLGSPSLLFDSVTLNADATLDATGTSGRELRLLNRLTVNATLRLVGPAVTQAFNSVTVDGDGRIVCEIWNNLIPEMIFNNQSHTISSSISIEGIARINGNSLVNHADLNGRFTILMSGSFTNTGVIESSTGITIRATAGWVNSGELRMVNGALTLGGSWSNAGTIHIQDATLTIEGNVTTAGLGTINRTGGRVRLLGTLDNNGSTLSLNANTGSWELGSGDAIGAIVGGSVSLSEGQTISIRSGKLDHVTLNGDLEMSAFGANLTIENGFILNGAIHLVDSGARVHIIGSQTISGTGEFVLDGGFQQYLSVLSNSDVITFADDFTLRGGTGTIYFNIGTLINQGTIRADISSQTLLVQPGALVNEGTIEARNGGKLEVHGLQPNAATIRAGLGSTVTISGAFTQLAEGRTEIQVAGTTAALQGRVAVTGAATFGGNLAIDFANGFVPAVGTTFTLLTYASRSGQFASITHNLSTGLALVPTYNAGNLTLTVAAAFLPPDLAATNPLLGPRRDRRAPYALIDELFATDAIRVVENLR